MPKTWHHRSSNKENVAEVYENPRSRLQERNLDMGHARNLDTYLPPSVA
jgi:hypothetical protein